MLRVTEAFALPSTPPYLNLCQGQRKKTSRGARDSVTLNKSIYVGDTFFAGMGLCSEGHQVGHWAWVTLCRLRRGLRYQGASFPLPRFVFFFCECEPEIETRNQDIDRQTNCTEDGPVLPAGGGTVLWEIVTVEGRPAASEWAK